MIKWLPITDWPLYEVSSCGEVRNVITKKPLRPAPDRDGYLRVRLCSGVRFGLSAVSRPKSFSVHGLVCRAFHGPRPVGLEVRHKNGVRADNRASNLEWTTHIININDKARHGSDKYLIGENNLNSVLTEQMVLEIFIDPRIQTEIAADYAVSQVMVSYIKRRQRWKHLFN
jgi:hypothetical protein